MKQSMVSRAMALAMVLVVLAFSVKGVTGQEPGPEQRNVAPAGVSIEAAVASRISYQGMLKESGAPVTGSRNMVFRLHRNSTCTSKVGSDIIKNGVPVAAGLFTVALDVPQSDFNGQALWLQVLVTGVSLGCHEITATPYALSLRPGALISDTLAGPVLTLRNRSAAVGIQSLVGSGTAEDLHPGGWLYTAAGEFVGTNGVIGAASNAVASGFGVTGIAQGTSGAGVRGQARASSGTTYGGWFDNLSTSGMGVYGEASAATGTTYGGRFVSASTTGTGVRGQASASSGTTNGGWFDNLSTSGRGVWGQASAASGTTYGGYFQSLSTSGTGVYGGAFAASGTTYGGHFLSASNEGRGVYGEASAATGATYGGYFVSASASGMGARGTALAATGTTYGGYFDSVSIGGTGLYGAATATSGTTYGVRGYQNSAFDGAAGYFLADNNAATSNVAGVYGRVDGDATPPLPIYGVAGHAYYDGVGVGAWSYSGRIFEGRDGDYPGGSLRFYMERNGAAYADIGWNTFVTAADGSEKVLYGTQSTEMWVEDFGTGQLAEGLGTVKIAADFAKTVNLTAEYHVFLTPMGDCALYVAEKTATSFTVRAIGGATCSIGFDYRLVAKQAGMESYRMTEIASPPAPEKVEEGPMGLP